MCGAPLCPGLGLCGIGQLHPVHPCFIAQLLCAVLLRSQDRNRLRTPGKHHFIIHHHLCCESQILAADLSKNSSNKYQGHFDSYWLRRLPRRLCGHASRHYSAYASKQRCIACLRGSSPERVVRALSRQTTEREQVLGSARGGGVRSRRQSRAGNATARVG